ncbi:MAG: Fur family transcriptional regulator [bacterium]
MVKENKMKISELMKGFEQVCKSKGLRITHQRSEIFHELAKYPDHPTAENVFSRVRKRLKTISLDTVYRTIATFEEHGMIKRVQILDNSARFDVNLSIHHHLICTRCNKIEDLYWPVFDKMKLPDSVNGWAKMNSRHVEIRSLCLDCKTKFKK